MRGASISVIILLMLNIPLTCYAFDIKIKDTTIEYGKPVWLTVTTPLDTPSLNKIDFSQTESDFEVVKDKNAIRFHDKGQSWRIRLFPRKEGPLTIPALKFVSKRSQNFNINVTPPVDNKTGLPFEVNYQISSTKPWLRQQVLVHYRIENPHSELVLEPQASSHPYLQVIPLNTAQTPQGTKTSHLSGWAVFSSKRGEHKLKLPALNYVRDGVITHRFYPPPVTLNVKPLPSYLPGNIPIGKLQFNIIELPKLTLKDRLSEITIQLSGNGIAKQWLPDLRYLFYSNHQMNTYPVETTSQQDNHGSISSRHTWTIPFKTNQQGFIDLPRVRLHYFDPDTGRLAKLDIKLPTFISLSSWLIILLGLIGIVVLSWFAIKLYKWLVPHWRCFKTYRDTFNNIEKLQTPQDVRQTIRQLSMAEGKTDNLSVRQWVNQLPANTRCQAQHIRLQLETALYQGKNYNMDEILSNVRLVCLQRWPIIKWI